MKTTDLCIDAPTEETEVDVATNTGAIVTIADRLLQPESAYPHVAAGTVVDSSTFADPADRPAP